MLIKLIQEYPGSKKEGTIIKTNNIFFKNWPQYWMEICPKCKNSIKVCNRFGCTYDKLKKLQQ